MRNLFGQRPNRFAALGFLFLKAFRGIQPCVLLLERIVFELRSLHKIDSASFFSHFIGIFFRFTQTRSPTRQAKNHLPKGHVLLTTLHRRGGVVRSTWPLFCFFKNDPSGFDFSHLRCVFKKRKVDTFVRPCCTKLPCDFSAFGRDCHAPASSSPQRYKAQKTKPAKNS